jgi:ABC-2 type transport system permease protein/lipopolysaccharide transport system permease protein
MSFLSNLVSKDLRLQKSLGDLAAGLRNWKIWTRLAWIGTREQYQRSVIGPFWITLGTLIMVLTFGLLYGHLMARNLSEHVPYVAIGLIFWILFSEIIIKGCHVFISNGRMIQQLPLPLSTYLYRLITQELIVFAHNSIIIIVVLITVLRSVGDFFILSFLGMILLLLLATSTALVFGIISTRFRDFPQIVQAFMRPMMFLTPIIWNAEMFPDRAAFVYLNPFYHIIEICRAPLLGKPADIMSWIIVVVLTLLILLLSIFLFSRYRHRIAYWV